MKFIGDVMAINYTKRLQEVQIVYAGFYEHHLVIKKPQSLPPPFSARERKRPFSEAIKLLQQLDELAVMLLQDPRPAFTLFGHTDAYLTNPVGAKFLEIDLEYLIAIVRRETRLNGCPSLFVYEILYVFWLLDRNSIRTPDWWKGFLRKDKQHLASSKCDIINSVLMTISAILKSKEFKKLLYKQTSNTNQKFNKCCEYVESLFILHEELMVFAMDFAWTKSSYDNSYLQSCLRKLLGNGRKHQALKSIVGFVGKWEYSPEKEIHARIIFFVPTKDVINKNQLIEGIKLYWINQVTKGEGIAVKVKLTVRHPKLNATACSISNKNLSLLNDFKNLCITYLTKSDIYFLPNKIGGNLPVESPQLMSEEIPPSQSYKDLLNSEAPSTLPIEEPNKPSSLTSTTIPPKNVKKETPKRPFKNIFFRGEMP